MCHSESHAIPTAVITVNTAALAVAANHCYLPSSTLASLLKSGALSTKMYFFILQHMSKNNKLLSIPMQFSNLWYRTYFLIISSFF